MCSNSSDFCFLKNCILGALKYQFKPSEVALYNISGIRDLKQLGFTLSSFTVNQIRGYFNNRTGIDLLKSRSRFAQWCSEHDIPCPNRFGLIPESICYDVIEKELDSIISKVESVRPEKLVIKSSGKSHGDGCLFIDKMIYEKGKCYAVFDFGDRRLLRNILTQCIKESGGDISVEEFLVQHKLLAKLNPKSINTVRIVTFLRSEGDVDLDGTVLRIGAIGSNVDSWRRGGLAASVDLESGIVGSGVKVGECRGGKWYTKHPETGIIIEGTVIPEWDRVLNLAKRATVNLPNAKWVGWDIAITDTGPVLLEGNSSWALPMILAHTEGRCPKNWEKRLSSTDLPIPRSYLSGIKYFTKMLIKPSVFR